MRITPRPVAQYPWYLRPFFWNQRRKYGAVLGVPAQGFCRDAGAAAGRKKPK